ncbi:uncharacterized protein LOC135847862 [Planococcus citri]|uniref:uncharacterized protein LOC135847862 n=1 Tax=Planococcus citri TaxID=170843 RepID=UPI0031F76017
MYISRVILTFLLTFYLNIPFNEVSAIYPSSLICKECEENSISFHAAKNEKFSLKYTGNAVEAFGPPTTNGTLTGGIFGDEVYQFYKLAYFWKTDYFTYKFTLQVGDIFFNKKYESYKNALNYPDGIVQICTPVFANGLIDNPLFTKFEKAFNQIKSNPGKITCIESGPTFNWIQHFPPEVTYVYFKSMYFDKDTGKSYPCATTVKLPLKPLLNFISCRQYLSTFGSLVDISKRPLNNPPLLDIPKSLVGFGWNIKVIDVDE